MRFHSAKCRKSRSAPCFSTAGSCEECRTLRHHRYHSSADYKQSDLDAVDACDICGGHGKFPFVGWLMLTSIWLQYLNLEVSQKIGMPRNHRPVELSSQKKPIHFGHSKMYGTPHSLRWVFAIPQNMVLPKDVCFPLVHLLTLWDRPSGVVKHGWRGNPRTVEWWIFQQSHLWMPEGTELCRLYT